VLEELVDADFSALGVAAGVADDVAGVVAVDALLESVR